MIGLLDDIYDVLKDEEISDKTKREVTKEDKFIVHWMSHDQIEIFVHVFTHCENMKEAEKQLKRLLAYIVGGWFAVIKTK